MSITKITLAKIIGPEATRLDAAISKLASCDMDDPEDEVLDLLNSIALNIHKMAHSEFVVFYASIFDYWTTCAIASYFSSSLKFPEPTIALSGRSSLRIFKNVPKDVIARICPEKGYDNYEVSFAHLLRAAFLRFDDFIRKNQLDATTVIFSESFAASLDDSEVLDLLELNKDKSRIVPTVTSVSGQNPNREK